MDTENEQRHRKALGSVELLEKVKTSSDGTKEYYYDPLNFKYIGVSSEPRYYFCSICKIEIPKEDVIFKKGIPYHKTDGHHPVIKRPFQWFCPYYNEYIPDSTVTWYSFKAGFFGPYNHPVHKVPTPYYWCPKCRKKVDPDPSSINTEKPFHTVRQALHRLYLRRKIVCQVPPCPICGKPGTCETAWGYCSEEHKTEMMDSLKNIMMVDEHDS